MATYRLSVPLYWSQDLTTADMIVELLVDGTLVATDQMVQEPQDSGGASPEGTGTNQRQPATIDGLFVNTVAGSSHTVQLRFTSSAAGAEPAIYGCRLWITRW